MSKKRRYSEQEIAAIFEKAAKEQEEAQKYRQTRDGLSLEELQRIGATAGIDPEYVARAAAFMESHPEELPLKYYAGLPYEVGRSVDLPSSFSDKDWDLLVVDLRDTFEASGKVTVSGSLRQWKNGNLQALVEPTEKGYRLRLTTKKGSLRGIFTMAVAYTIMTLIILTTILTAETTSSPTAFVIPLLFFLAGVAPYGWMAMTQSRWARSRATQMEAVVARAVARSQMHHPDGAELEEQVQPLIQLDDRNIPYGKDVAERRNGHANDDRMRG